MQENVSYIVKRNSRSRSVKISVDPKGNVIVTTHPLVPQFVIKQAVSRAEVWIHRNVAKVRRATNNFHEQYDLMFKGKEYRIQVDDQSHHTGVYIEGNTMRVVGVNSSKESIKKQLTRFYKTQAEEHISSFTYELSQQMNVTYDRLILRDQKTRWGSCSSQKTISINWKLIQTPEEVMRYVIIHELSHLTHMNHSKAFWDRVKQFDPQYKEHRNWLKVHTVLLHSTILS